MDRNINEVIEKIAGLPANWHGAGTVDASGLRAIAKYAEAIGPIYHSVETGSGKTTLLFSHLSGDHVVFAVDAGDSISQVRRSPLFRRDTVCYVEGSTQRTLPAYKFAHKVQIALIDGPHGYPFPDLEYFYFYPIIEAGGLLLVDDIPIPSIKRMFEIIRADDMFELLDVVNGNMAIFRRTTAPLIDPESDSWWLQGYNRLHYEQVINGTAGQTRLQSIYRPILKQALQRASSLTPKRLKDRVPARIKNKLWSKL